MSTLREAIESSMPGPEDGSVRVLTKFMVLAEFADSDGARQFVWMASENMQPWEVAGFVRFADIRLGHQLLTEELGGDE